MLKTLRVPITSPCKTGLADNNRATAPATCGEAMEVPLRLVYAVSLARVAERVLVPGAEISGFSRMLPSAVMGPRLLKEAMLSVPVLSAPTL